MSLSQIELVWVRVTVEWRVFLSESERRWQDVWIQDGSVWIQHGRIQVGCHHQVESEWMSEVFFVQNGWESNLGRVSVSLRGKLSDGWFQRWPNSRWVIFKISYQSESELSENEFEWIWVKIELGVWVQSGVAVSESNLSRISRWLAIIKVSLDSMSGSVSWIQDGRIQDGCHHQVESESMSLSQVELVCVRVLNTMAESKMAEFKMAEYKMATIIKLSQNEWIWVRLNVVWVRVRVEWERFWVNLREDNKVSESKMAVSESNLAEFKMAAIIKLSQNEWVWVRMN